MLDNIHFPKQNVDYYYSYDEFEAKLLNSVLSGNANRSASIYHDFFVTNEFFNSSISSDTRKIKNQTISLLSVICHNVKKIGVSPYSTKSMLDESITLIEKASKVKEIYELGRAIIIGFSTQTLTGTTNISTDNPTIKKALHYIHDNLGENLTLEDVASHVHLSKYYFCTQFKKETNMTFIEYVNYTRVEKSKFFLCHSDKSILDIAILLGFSNQEYFTLVFRKYTNTTPKQFKIENESYY